MVEMRLGGVSPASFTGGGRGSSAEECQDAHPRSARPESSSAELRETKFCVAWVGEECSDGALSFEDSSRSGKRNQRCAGSAPRCARRDSRGGGPQKEVSESMDLTGSWLVHFLWPAPRGQAERTLGQDAEAGGLRSRESGRV